MLAHEIVEFRVGSVRIVPCVKFSSYMIEAYVLVAATAVRTSLTVVYHRSYAYNDLVRVVFAFDIMFLCMKFLDGTSQTRDVLSFCRYDVITVL